MGQVSRINHGLCEYHDVKWFNILNMNDDKKGIWVLVGAISIGLGMVGGVAVFAALAITLSIAFVVYQFFSSSNWEYRKWPKLAGTYQISIPSLTRYSSVVADVTYTDSTVAGADGFWKIKNICAEGTVRNIWGELSPQEQAETNQTIQDYFDRLFIKEAAHIRGDRQ